MTDRDSHHRVDVGYTIPAFAERYGIHVKRVRRAISLGEIRTVTFSGRPRITPTEAKRVAELFGLKPGEKE